MRQERPPAGCSTGPAGASSAGAASRAATVPVSRATTRGARTARRTRDTHRVREEPLVLDAPAARQWIATLPAAVAAQAAVLARLLDAADADVRIRGLQLKGSLARGAADEYSDVDARLWVADEGYAQMLRDLPSLARGLGETLDILFETPASPFLFVQFVDGVQLELATWRASDAKGSFAGEVVLLDRDGCLAGSSVPAPPWDVRLWVGWAWMRLFDVDKYLRRGSLWEALLKLEEARVLLLQHHAAEHGLRDPQLGLTSILDFDGPLPARLEETVARLDATDLRRAAHVCAQLLVVHDRRPFGDYVLDRLAAGGNARDGA
jgi:predicted nucleotidyltransferase